MLIGDCVAYFAIKWLIYDTVQSPEWCAALVADKPGRAHATEPRDARLEAGQIRLVLGIVRVHLAQHVLVALRRFDGKTVCPVHLQHGLDHLKCDCVIANRPKIA